MTGKLYGLGVGPGDPELLTVKALRLVKESDVIAVPGAVAEESVAYKIVKGVYGELDEKTLIPIPMPMTKDPAVLEENHRKAADTIEELLKQGKQVAFLTLGDPTVYSTYLYVHKRILERGYEVEIVSGIPSFCAVAATLNMGLVEMAEPLHVIPAFQINVSYFHILCFFRFCFSYSFISKQTDSFSYFCFFYRNYQFFCFHSCAADTDF